MSSDKKELKYCIETWGCQMNEEDSEKLSGMLKRQGYTATENREEASIIIFNTCCVRENAENKVFGNLGLLKKQKEKNPDLIIAICGCMMQQKGMADKVLSQFPFVDIIFGTHIMFHCFFFYHFKLSRFVYTICRHKTKNTNII